MATLPDNSNQFGLGDVFSIIGGLGGLYEGYKGGDDVVTKPYYVGGQQEALEQGMDLARQQADAGPMGYYPGQTVADRDPNQTAGEDRTLSQMDRMQQLGTGAGQAIGTLQAGGADRVSGFELPGQVGFGIPEQYQNAIMNPIMRNLNEKIIPGIHTAATQQGAFGGSRMQQQKSDAATQATEAATDAMIQGNLQARRDSIGQRAGDISAQLEGRGQDIRQNQMYNDAMARGAAGAGAAQGALARPGQIQSDIGGQRTLYDQTLIEADKAGFDWTRDENINYIDRLLQRGNLAPTGGKVTPGAPGGFMAGLAGWGAGTKLPDTFNMGGGGWGS